MTGPPDIIETQRLRLVPLQVADAGELAAALGDIRLYEWIGGQPPTEEQLRARFQRLEAGGSADSAEEWLNWVVRQRDGGEAVGRVEATVFPVRAVAAVAWVIGTPWQRRGYGTEATRALTGWLLERGVPTLVADVHPGNVASEIVARRAGFVVTDEVFDGERRWHLHRGA
ncbi:MAG: GNAT family N-acetyltransferase [Acidimicrobiia bacterium]